MSTADTKLEIPNNVAGRVCLLRFWCAVSESEMATLSYLGNGKGEDSRKWFPAFDTSHSGDQLLLHT